MNNGFVHDLLLNTPREMFRALGAVVTREFVVRVGTRLGIIDLHAKFPGWTVACEGENTPRRAPWDIQKAEAAGVNEALILTPTFAVAQACRRKLSCPAGWQEHGSLRIWVLPLGAFPQWVANNFRLFSPSFDVSKTSRGLPEGQVIKPILSSKL